MQNNRWSAALPYGPGWGTNTPGGVASCMTWDATPRVNKWETSSGNYARPRTATIPAGAARYLLEPSLNYDDRQTYRDASADYPMNVYPANQFPHQTPQNCDDHLRHGPRGQSRCGAQVHHYDEDLVVSTPVCCCSDRNQPRTARKCEACSYRRYQDGGRRTPKPPVKFVQFAPEEAGRVIEIVEDVQGRPVTMAISRPTTPSQMLRNQRGHGTQQQRQWTRTYPQNNAEIVDVVPGYVVADENRNANDVRRLMNIYQAGKADTNFHKGVSEKWRSAVVSAGPSGREEVLTETKEREKTVAVRRYQRVRYPTKQTIGNEADQHYIQNEYEPHRNSLITRSNGMTVVQQRQPCGAHGWRDPNDGRMRAWEADEDPQPPNRVKLQIECPANVDTVVNVRVRPDADYRFN